MNRHDVHGLTRQKLREIAAMYGKNIAEFGLVEGGYRNVSHSFVTTTGESLNFILYKREPGSASLIERTNDLSLHILAQGLPVRAAVDRRILRVGQRYGSLYGYLPGQTIPWEAYTMKHIKLLGFTLGRFHAAAKNFGASSLPLVEDVYRGIVERMTQYFSVPATNDAIFCKLGLTLTLPDLMLLLDTAYTLDDRQALHMDMVRSNVLFRPTRTSDSLAVGSVAVSGILDLEKAAVGHPLFDLARTLSFLLVDCSKPPEKIRKYFLDSGYVKRGGGKINITINKSIKLSTDELLEQLVTMFLTYDFYKFLKQNPYESLEQNHHFVRTRDILRARKVLQYDGKREGEKRGRPSMAKTADFAE